MPARRHHPSLPPSSFPALAECPQYKSGGEPGAAAIRGTRIGATVESLLTGSQIPDAFSPEELDRDHEAEREEILWAVAQVRALYENNLPEIEAEIPLLSPAFEEITFGTLDYYRAGHLSDLKTGERRNYRRQMAVLSLGLMDRDGLDRMKVSIIWSKFRDLESWEWSREEAEALVWPVVEAVQSGAPARPCSYCSWCSKRETCPARIQAVNSLPAIASSHENLSLYMESLSPEERGEIFKKIKVAAKWCEDAGRAIEGWFLEAPEARPMAGFKLGSTKPKRVWHNELDAGAKLRAKALDMGRDPDALWDTKLVGTTKVKELLGQSKAVVSLIDSLLVQPAPRPAIIEDWGRAPLLAAKENNGSIP